MFTNYDGRGSGFGNTLVKSESSDRNTVSAYSATDENGDLRVILTNKSLHEKTPISLTIGGETGYSCAEVYELYGDSTDIRSADPAELDGRVLEYFLKPLSVTELVFKASQPVQRPEEQPDKNGFPVIPTAVGAGIAVAAAIAVALIKIKGQMQK